MSNTYVVPSHTIALVKKKDHIITKWNDEPLEVEDVEYLGDKVYLYVKGRYDPICYHRDRSITRLPKVSIESLAGE